MRDLSSTCVLLVSLVGCRGDDRPNAVAGSETRADTAPAVDSGSDGGIDSSSDTAIFDSAATDTTVNDTGPIVITDATIPDGSGDEFLADTGMVLPDASPALVPVGKACSASSECDPTGAKVGICSNQQLPPDAIDPTPVCMALACEAGSAIGKPCGLGAAGLCVGAGRCLAGCSFGSTGAAVGCVGKDACRPYGWERVSGSAKGIGSCSGGCAADADCPTGQVCQSEDGTCVATKVTYGKSLGSACTSSTQCPCRLNGSAGLGVCVRFCKTGDPAATCPSGFTCDPDLPASDSTGTLFTGVPTGLSGTCSKNCTNDSDCVTLGGHCESNVATGVKVCRVP